MCCMKKYLMKIFWSTFLLLICISCDGETQHEYQENISKPDTPETIVESFGCGNIFVYQYLDSLRALTVKLDGENLTLTKESQRIDLSNSDPRISVVLEIAGNSSDSIYFNFCDDVAYINSGVTTKYEATSGQLVYSVSEDNPIKEQRWETFYYITIKIENLHLYNKIKKEEIIINEIIFWNVAVGWLPG